jgi:hypothetical protein
MGNGAHRSTRPKRGGPPRALAELMTKAYPGKEPEDAAAIRVLSWWRKAVPERVVERARPVRFKGGIMVIHTASSAWAQELDFAREDLLASLRRSAPDLRIRELRFRVGPLPQLPSPLRADAPADPVVALSTLPETLARALSAIDDDALRDAIARAAGVGLAREASTAREADARRGERG